MKQWNRNCGTVEQKLWNSGTSTGETVEHLMVEKLNRHGETVSRSSDGGTLEHLMVEQ